MENKKDVKNTKTKKSVKLNSTMLIVGAVVVVLVIILVAFLIFGGGKGDEKEKQKEEKPLGPQVTEQDLETAYGMSKQDAIDIIKATFHSDNFTFAAEINSNNKYTVTVTNTLTNDVYKYEVEPLNGNHYIIEE